MVSQVQHWLANITPNTAYVIKLVVVVIAVVIINLILRRVFGFLINRSKHHRNPWDHIFWQAVSLPLRSYIWAIGICYLLTALLHFINAEEELQYVTRIFQLLTVFAIAWFVQRSISQAEKYFITHISTKAQQQKGPSDRGSIKVVARIAQVAVGIMVVLVAMGVLGIRLSGLLTFGGISGVILAFASKDLLSNFAGGMLIYFNRQFAVGDWISSPDRQIEGTVEYIGWRITRIRSFEQRPIYVPNAIFNTIIVVNPSRMTNRRIYQNIGVRYDDASKIPGILQQIRDLLKKHPDIDQERTTLVNITEFADSSINFMVYTFTKTTKWGEWLNIQDDVLLKIESIIAKAGAECAFPTRTLHVPNAVMVQAQSKK